MLKIVSKKVVKNPKSTKKFSSSKKKDIQTILFPGGR